MATDAELRYLVSVNDKELDQLESKVKRVNKAMGKESADAAATAGAAHDKTTKRIKASTVAYSAAGIAAFAFGKSAIQSAINAEERQARLEKVLDNSVKGWRAHKKAIDESINSLMLHSGFTKGTLKESFTDFARVTGDVNKALKLNQLAADLARGKHISLEQATKALVKAQNGSSAALKRFGIVVPAVTSAVDQLKESHKKYTKAQLDAAKAEDKRKQSMDVIAEAQRQFSGSADAFSKTTAGQTAVMQAQWAGLKTSIGQALLPVVKELMTKLIGFVEFVKEHASEVKIFALAVGAIAIAYKTVSVASKLVEAGQKAVAAATWLVNAAMSANPIVLVVAALVALGVALVIAWKKSETFRDIVLGTWNVLKKTVLAVTGAIIGAFEDVVGWFQDNWKTIATVIAGPFAPLVALATNAFGIRDALVNAFRTMVSAVETAAGKVWDAIKTALMAPIDFHKWLFDNIVTPIGSFLATAVTWGANIAIKVWEGITHYATDFAGWIKNRIIDPVTGAIQSLISAGTGISQAVWNGVTHFVTDMAGWVVNRILTPIKEAGSALIAAGTGMAESVWAGVTHFVTAMGEWVTNRILTPIHDAGKSLIDAGWGMTQSIWAGITSFVTDMAGWISNHILKPIAAGLDDILGAGKSIASAIARGIREGASAVWDTVVAAFKGFVNQIIRVINYLPLVDINPLAEGTITRGPQIAMVGEDGPEAVIPLSRRRRRRGLKLLEMAAAIMGVQGDVGEQTARRLGIPRLADGGIIGGVGGAVGGGGGIAAFVERLALLYRSGASQGLFEDLADAVKKGLGWFLGRLPSVPDNIPYPFNLVGRWILDKVGDLFTFWMDHGPPDHTFDIIKAGQWSYDRVTRGRYLWGGGHGGWDFTRFLFDCSGFASHAAKLAGSSIPFPMTTSDTLGIAARGARGPVTWGWRHMGQSDPRQQHMGIKILDQWFSFGPALGDSNWQITGVPPGLPQFRTGTPYVQETGPALVHKGEAIIPAGQRALVHVENMWVTDRNDAELVGVAMSRRLRRTFG